MTRHPDITSEGDRLRMSDNGWRAQLDLDIRKSGGKSVVARTKRKGPLTIQKPFYPEGEVCHLYLLHPPAGVVGGDKLGLTVQTEDEGSVLITTPGATKFYRTNGRRAEQHQHFTVSAGTSIEWLPQETIYFPDSDARLQTMVDIEGDGRFLGWEIHCLGLPVNNKDFGSGRATIGFSLFKDHKPVLLESIKISEQKRLFDAAFLKGCQVFGTFVASGADQELCEKVRQALGESEAFLWGATVIDEILIVRYLGDDTAEARRLFISAWEIIRPEILGRQPSVPRIWAT